MKTMIAAALAALFAAQAGAQQTGGVTGPGENAPDSHTVRSVDEQTNHPHKNARKRHCSYHKNASGKSERHCTWK